MKFDFRILEDLFVTNSQHVYEDMLMQQCFDIVGVFVAAVDLNGNITLINKKGAEMLGHTRNSIIGKNLIDSYIIDEKKAAAQDLFDQVILDKIPYPETAKYYLKSTTGNTIIVEAKHVAIRNKQNHILGILLSGENVAGYINTQRDLQDDLKLYRIMANNVPDINLYLFDGDKRFILAEGNEMKNIGMTSAHFEEKRLSELPDEKIKKIWDPLFNGALEGETLSAEFTYKRRHYRIVVLPIDHRQHGPAMGMAITRNITREKHLSNKLRKSKEEAEASNRSKSEFLARVSHEIRTPLNAIQGFTEQLSQTRLSKKQKDFARIIDASSEHLLSLINDILVISKIEANELSFEQTPFKVRHVVEYVFRALSGKAREKKLRFSYRIDDQLDRVLIGDSFRLRQILINMLNNAMKFTEKGSVELICHVKKVTSDVIWAAFDVKDTGIGINRHHLKRIFEQFRQADENVSRKFGGTGLGLTICKSLIEMQHGNLTVTSQEGIGTTFSFELPYRIGNETDIIMTGIGELDRDILKGKKVLLVDDDSTNRLLGEIILKKMRCDFDMAVNGSEAIMKLNQKKYDVILLDIHLPDMNGIDIARHIRRTQKDTTTRIIAVTAVALKRNIRSYFDNGFDDFLIKPFREINLFNKMCEVLKIKSHPVVPSKTEIILMEELEDSPYDLSELIKMVGNDETLKAKMLNTFIANTETALKAFHKSLKEENWEQIGETAHRILPSYRHLRADRIVSDLMELKNKTLIAPAYNLVPALLKNTVKGMEDLISMLRKETG